jgi:hypothetical protein
MYEFIEVHGTFVKIIDRREMPSKKISILDNSSRYWNDYSLLGLSAK